MTRHRVRLSRFAFAAVLGLGLAACWSVPADPGRNAALRGRAAPAAATVDRGGYAYGAADPGARELYVSHCARCHEPFSPSHATPEQWPAFVNRYGPRAGLFGADRERVLRWLQANAR